MKLIITTFLVVFTMEALAAECAPSLVCERIHGGPNNGKFVVMFQYPSIDHGHEFCAENGVNDKIYETASECLASIAEK